jgi:hypothetical protein
MAVTAVQFKLDGANLGAAVTGAGPLYNLSWSTLATPNGTHTLSAVAVNAAAITGTSGNVSVTVANAQPLSSLQCAVTSLASNSDTTCTITLSNSTTSSTVVTLSGNTPSLLTIPPSVSVPANAIWATFSVLAGTVTTNQTSVITATLSSTSVTASLNLSASSGQPTRFSLAGIRSEVSGTVNGSTVTPAVGPAGAVVVNGTGAVQFSSGGVSFAQGGQQNTNTAFYTFVGQQTQQIFGPGQGQISFNLTSRYNFADRVALPSANAEFIFDVYDNAAEQFYFTVQAGSVLVLSYKTGGTIQQAYVVPSGTEDALFGKGNILNVKLVWNGSQNELYLNGNLAYTQVYTQAAANWTSQSSFSIGASDAHCYGGGFFSTDDAIGGFLVQGN